MGMGVLKTAVSSGEKYIEGSTDMVLNFQKASGNAMNGLGGFLGSPLSYVGIGLVAIIILPKVLNKM